MIKSKVLLLSLGMALCAAGGIGAAVAITQNEAGNTGTGDFDKAISLYWGSKSSSVDLDDMEELAVNKAEYRYLSVTPESSKSVAGEVTVSFTLAPVDASHDIEGITVNVYETASLATDDTVAGLIASATPAATITKASATDSVSFDVESGEATHVTNAYYAIEVIYDGSSQALGKTLGGNLAISQAFAAE